MRLIDADELVHQKPSLSTDGGFINMEMDTKNPLLLVASAVYADIFIQQQTIVPTAEREWTRWKNER